MTAAPSSSLRRFCAAAALLVLLFGGLLRFARWGMPLTFDEAFMLHFYSSRTVRHVVTDYTEPNNHVLLAAAMRVLDVVYPKKLIHTLADHKPLQLPGILASIVSLILLHRVALRLTSPPAALLALTVFALSHWHLSYSHMIRGYSLSVMVNLFNIWIVLESLRRPRLLWALPLGLAAAHYIITINLFFSMALFLWSWFWLKSRSPKREYGLHLFLVFFIGIVLTLLTWWPLMDGILGNAKSNTAPLTLGNFLWRWVIWLRVLGKGQPYQFYFAVVAALGFGLALAQRKRWPMAAGLIAVYLTVPVLATAVQGATAPFRVYTSLLPIWALAHGLGLYALGVWLRRRLGRPWPFMRVLLVLLVGASTALAGGQLAGFLTRNKGLLPREVMIRMSEETREWDDFAVIYNQLGEDPDLWELAWEYYGYAAHIEPYVRLGRFSDLPYLLRGRYLILAKDKEQALDSAARSALDPFLLEGLRELPPIGEVRVFRVDLDSATLDRYRAAVASPNTPPRLRAKALTGLGCSRLKTGDYSGAIGFLKKAKALDAFSRRTRYYLGLAYYLSFDDARAVPELLAASRGGGNVHAPFYLADSLAELGRDREALLWYAFYRKGPMHPGVWFSQDRATRGDQSVQRGLGRVRRMSSDARAWDGAAAGYFNKGAYERAVLAAQQAEALDPSTERLAVLSRIQHSQRDYAGAVETLRQAVAREGRSSHKIMLARQLLLRRGYVEASKLTAEVLRADPGNAEAEGLALALKRF